VKAVEIDAAKSYITKMPIQVTVLEKLAIILTATAFSTKLVRTIKRSVWQNDGADRLPNLILHKSVFRSVFGEF
jgi:hypothetical protein